MESPTKSNESVTTAVEPPSSSRTIPPVDATTTPGSEAHRRRYRILKQLADNRIVTIDDLRNDRNFRRTFPHCAENTLLDDFRYIDRLLGGGRAVFRENSRTLAIKQTGGSSFAELGYGITDPSDNTASLDIARKRRIGDYVINRLLDGANEVVYMSTGTSVYQVAQALIHADEQLKRRISVLLTNNLAVIELLSRYLPTDPCLQKMSLEVLGGKADFATGDICPPSDREQLDPWECTSAIMAANALNPATGQIFSFRQPEMKQWVLNRMSIAKVIVPLTPNKIGVTGGRLIFDPKRPSDGGEMDYHIVTTSLDAEKKERLERFPHYTVHCVGEPVSS